MKTRFKDFRFTSRIGILLMLALAFHREVAAKPSASFVVYSGEGREVRVPGVQTRSGAFLNVDSAAAALGIALHADSTDGLDVLCTTYDCRPVYLGDEQEVLWTDTAVYVRVNAVAEALGCEAKIKRKREVHLTCGEGRPSGVVGAKVGERAAGFRLKANGVRHGRSEETPLLSPRERKETPLLSPRERGENGDSVVALNDLLSRGAVVVAFVRSGDWDPMSRLLLSALESRLDSLRREGCEVVAIHGYEPKVGAKWATDLKLHFAQLSDHASAVMRGYEVFDQGHLPHCALFLLDRRGIICFRQVFGSEVVAPDIGPLLREVRGMRDEG